MDVGKIIVSSFRYPFRNIAKLPILFVLFVLMAIIPIAKLLDNTYLMIFGVVAFFIFILIVPGYLVSIIKTGSIGSDMLPSYNLKNNILDSIRVLCLRIVYMIVPACVFFIVMSTLGSASIDLLYNLQIHTFLATIGLIILLVLGIWIIFEVLLFFAKARLAYFNSFSEAVKINRVVGDIRKIGIFNIIKWMVLMVIVMTIISFITSFVLSIPYVGFLIYIGVVIPFMESVANYSLGLLYSNITKNYDALTRVNS